MIGIVGEGKKGLIPYSYEELLHKCEVGEPVAGKVIKCTADDILLVELGNGLVGELSFNDFADTIKPISKAAFIGKVGKVVEAKVEQVTNQNIKLNRAALQKEYKDRILRNTLTPGVVIDTTVVSIAPFGIFVDLGCGVIALLPNEDISIARIFNIKEVFYPGKEIKVVYKYEKDGQYVVSHKELLGTWQENVDKFTTGEVVQGVVYDKKDFGIFVEIAPNLAGLADIPEFDVQIGDSVSVFIKGIVAAKMKLKLNIVSKTDIPYETTFDYKITQGKVKEWVYTPEGYDRKIATIFE